MRRSHAREAPVPRAQHALRVLALVAFAAALYGTVARRAEVSSSDALAAVQTAEHMGTAVDPSGANEPAPILHALAIRGAHSVVFIDGPEGWERAAQLVSIVAGVLLAIPIYLLALELYESRTAWLGTVLFLSTPLMGYIVANLYSEGLFLLLWAWGLWAAIRFLRDGRWFWLPLFVGAATCAATLRLDGIVLAVFFWIVVALMPWNWAAPARRAGSWPVYLVLNVALIAAVSPLRVDAQPARNVPAAAMSWTDNSSTEMVHGTVAARVESRWEFCGRAVARMWKVTRNAVSLRLLPLALLGLLLAWSGPAQARVWLFLSLLLAGGLGLLIERRATVGDCTLRDALVPALLLILPAGHGLGRLARRVVVEGVDLRGRFVRYQPGALVWFGLLLAIVVLPNLRTLTPPDSQGAFAPYRATSTWLAEHGIPPDQVADFTGWTTFGLRPPLAPARPRNGEPERTHVVVRQGQVLGRSEDHEWVAALVGDRPPVARFPTARQSRGLEVRVYDLDADSLLHARAAREKNDRLADLRLISEEKQSNVKQ